MALQQSAYPSASIDFTSSFKLPAPSSLNEVSQMQKTIKVFVVCERTCILLEVGVGGLEEDPDSIEW